jgi:hypothetical protein
MDSYDSYPAFLASLRRSNQYYLRANGASIGRSTGVFGDTQETRELNLFAGKLGFESQTS